LWCQCTTVTSEDMGPSAPANALKSQGTFNFINRWFAHNGNPTVERSCRNAATFRFPSSSRSHFGWNNCPASERLDRSRTFDGTRDCCRCSVLVRRQSLLFTVFQLISERCRSDVNSIVVVDGSCKENPQYNRHEHVIFWSKINRLPVKTSFNLPLKQFAYPHFTFMPNG
jgi:hypothetical protein